MADPTSVPPGSGAAVPAAPPPTPPAAAAPPPSDHFGLSRTSWAQEVAARSLKLRDRIPLVDPGVRGEIGHRLDQADALCTARSRLFSWDRLVDWWFGNRVEDAWTLLHNVELLIIDNASEALLPVIIEDAVNHANVLDQTDPARVRLTTYVNSQNASPGQPK